MADELTPEQKLHRELAVLRSSQAPLIFFEAASTYGVQFGVCRVTLEAAEPVPMEEGVVRERRVVAHLRFPVATIATLRVALDRIEAQLKPSPGTLKN